MAGDTPLYLLAGFYVGAAIKSNELLSNRQYREIVLAQFNSVSTENTFKAEYIQPQEKCFDWKEAEYLAGFCAKNNKRLHGHTLIWHQGIPDWMHGFKGDRQAWINLLKTHIQTIVKRFKGRVSGWDVVNEAFNEDGSLRAGLWLENIGPEYIELSFLFAQEADPAALLFYNDFSLEYNPVKRIAVLNCFDTLRGKGIRVDGIGLQLHMQLEQPEISLHGTLTEIVKAGFMIHLSEIDISVNHAGTIEAVTDERLAKQAQIAVDVIAAYAQVPAKLRYGATFWGVGDADSWMRTYRYDSPLLFDDNYNAKPVYYRLRELFTLLAKDQARGS
jgi:endo-1,4-beta-xylanase